MKKIQKSLTVIIFIAVFLLLMAPTGVFFAPKIKTAKAVALTSVTVAPNANNVDNLIGQTSASWKFTVNNATALTALSTVVEITFPESVGNFTFSGLSATSTATGGDAITFATTSLPVINGNKVRAMVLNNQTSANNDFTIILSGITNPVGETSRFTAPLSWTVSTCTLAQAGNPASDCSPLDTPVAGTAQLKRRGGAITDASITATSTAAAAVTQYRLQFTASTTLNIGEKIWVSFPVGFDVNTATTSAQLDINGAGANAPRIANGAIATSTNWGLNALILTTSNAAIAAGDTVTVTFGRITNPAKGAYQGFKFFTTSANNGLIDGSYMGQDSGSQDFGPPPVDSIQIGGTNTINIIVKMKQADGTLRTVTAEEAAQMQVGAGCPDLMFYVGTKKVASNGTVSYTGVLDATYVVYVMPITESGEFFQNYIKPNMIQVTVTGSETVSLTPTFYIPDSFIAGSITGGPASATGIFVRAYTGEMETFGEVYNSRSYTTEGLDGSGVGYFRLPVKFGYTWKVNMMTNSTLTSGSTEYWTPNIDPIYVPDATTVTTTASAFAVANKKVEVTLRKSSDNSVVTSGGPGSPCLNIRKAGEEMMGPGGQGVCTSSPRSTYVLKAPAGPFVIQVMAPGRGFKEYPVNVLSDSATTTKEIIMEAPNTYISGTVKDGENNAIQGASVFAQGSNGGFSSALTNSSGVYTLYVNPGTYRVDGFAPGYGPLTAKTNVPVSASSNATGQNFTLSSGDYKLIQGRVYSELGGTAGVYDAGTDTPYQGVQINAYNGSGGNGTQSRSDGSYTLRVPAGTYTVEAWDRNIGMVAPLTNVNAAANIADQNFVVAAQGYLQIRITDGNTASLSPVFAGAFSATGRGNGSDSFTATTTPGLTDTYDLVTKFSLPAGSYNIRVGTPAYGDLTDLAANSGARTVTITAGAISNKILTLPTLYTLSGTAAANAVVWVSKTDGPGRYTATADASGNYSIKVPAGTFMVGANLTGYVNLPTQQTIAGNTALNLTLTASEATISGTVSNASTAAALAQGFVWAVKGNDEGWVGSEVSASGTYSLEVDNGTWKVYADGPCYYQSSGTNQTGAGTVNISLIPNDGCTMHTPEMNSMVPSSGGKITQSDVSVNIPANALGTGSSAVTVNVATPNVVPPSTLNAAPVSGAAKTISASDSSGSAISTLNNAIEVTLTYSEADLPFGSTESDLQMAFWNSTTNTWDTVASTLDTVNNTLTASVTHLTDFAPVLPTGDDVPSTPTGLTATRSTTDPIYQINLSWTQVSGATGYYIYRDTSSSGNFPLLATISSGTTLTYSSTGLNSNTTYYYKITSSNANGESAASSVASASTNALPSSNSGGGAGGIPAANVPAAPITTVQQLTTSQGAESAVAPQAAPTATAQSTTNGTVVATSASGGTTQATTEAGTTVKVIVPPAAVTVETTVAVTQQSVVQTVTGGDTATTGSGASMVPTAPAGNAIIGGRAYSVSATAQSTAISSFNDSLTLTFTYTDAEVAGVNESSLKVHYYNVENDAWVSLTSTVDTAANTITAYVNHLTTFAIIGALSSDSSTFEGKAVKSAGSPAVYLVNNGYRRAFTSEMMFFSYGYTWADVQAADVNNIPLGPNMVYSDSHTFTAGQMIKGANEKVYFIDNAGYRHWVESETVYLGLGYEWKQVAWISDAALDKYAEGSNITSISSRPNGSLVKYAASDKVYLIDAGKKRWIVNETAFNNYNYGWYNIITIPDTEIYGNGGNLSS